MPLNFSNLNRHNKVIVRVWTSEGNKQYPGNNVGHVSIEIHLEGLSKPIYISLWPVPFTQKQIEEFKKANFIKQQYLRYYSERDAKYMRNYQEDYEAEGNIPPQIVMTFYSLDIDAILKEFYQLKREQITGWRLIGSNFFIQECEGIVRNLVKHSSVFHNDPEPETVENCASLALKLLRAGGIEKLVHKVDNSIFTSQTSSVVSPDKILDILFPAKINEQKEIDKQGLTDKLKNKKDTPLPGLSKPVELPNITDNNDSDATHSNSKTMENDKKPCLVM